MTGEVRRPLSYRALWSLLLAIAAVGLPWTGVALHAAGHQGWSRATHAWMAAHWVFALLFTVGASGHVVVNGRALLRHLRLASRALPLSREAVTALLITGGLLLLAVGHTRLMG